MNTTTLRRSILALPVLAAAALAACTGDVTSPASAGIKAPAGARHLMVTPGSTINLASGLNLPLGSEVNWYVDTPEFGSIRLRFDARNDFSSTAGSAPTLEVLVNDNPVDQYQLANKPLTYTYKDGRSETYYENRGMGGQASPYWVLFYSPDFVQNTQSTNSYYVTTGQPYTYELTISSLIFYGGTNKITLRNKAQWLQNATGSSITIATRNVTMTEQ